MNSPEDTNALPAPAAPAAPELPPYPGLRLEDVQVIHSQAAAESALSALLAADALGFDTESKPTFRKGEESTGPHLIQLATEDRAWLFPLTAQFDATILKPLLESARILKIGFGLKDDVKRLAAKYGIHTQGIVDLSVALRGIQRQDFGAKTAVAHFFGQKLQKSKKISTTNWSNPRYTPGQILYAANDAQVPLRVYREWLKRGGGVKS
ncbi:MAG: 3'-5' exonuclease domain-containing protein 2 [Rhodocyclaceae bacterium]|nr:MAG: 3'-5' exonuclease domain-containing protein 2 [Rhodocyclaceae bacterium]